MISADQKILRGQKGPFFSTLQELRKHFERIDVLCYPSQTGEQNVEMFENVFFHPSKATKYLQHCWIQRRGADLIKEHNHDMMTVHGYPPLHHVYGALRLSRAVGVPCGVEVHGLAGTPRSASLIDWIGGRLSRWYLPYALKQATGTRVINETLKQTLTQWGVHPSAISVVRSFYWDPLIWKPDWNAQKEHDCVFVGRIDRNKGLEDVIRAIARLPVTSYQLSVIGDGPDRERCERLAQSLGVGGRVQFLGWLPEASDVAAVVQRSKVLIMNSRSEGGPRVTLEAMACGVPVISTKVGVMPDVLKDGENGLWTDGTPDDLAEKIEQLLSNDALREAMGKNAAGSLQGFEKEVLIRNYAEWLKKLANRYVTGY